MPTASTVSNRAASSPLKPAAAIQLAEILILFRPPICAAAMLLNASPIAMRPEAGAFITAIGERSPIAIASPVIAKKPDAVTATSATGTCQGPTIWSRATSPVIERSPI